MLDGKGWSEYAKPEKEYEAALADMMLFPDEEHSQPTINTVKEQNTDIKSDATTALSATSNNRATSSQQDISINLTKSVLVQA